MTNLTPAFIVLLAALFTAVHAFLPFKHSPALPRLGLLSRLAGSGVDDFSRPAPVAPAPTSAASEAEAAEGEAPVEAEVKPKAEISSAMRDKLRRELQAQGADANVSAGNPILVISGIIALLVIIGGKDFFY